jgi:predicted DCC family thiol-disulfide oxidoreductase YuxK
VTTRTGTLVYDGDCGFCTRSAEWLAARGRATIQPSQTLDLDAVGLTEDDVASAAWWLDADGRVAGRGAEAAAEALKTCRGPWRLVGHVLYARPWRPLADAAYQLVADNRHRLPGSTPMCQR